MFAFFRKKQLAKTPPAKAIDDIVNQYIGPLLREAGFKKSTRTWVKGAGEYSFVINVRANRWNSKETGASFVVNYGVFLPSLHRKFFETEPPKNPKEYDCLFSGRVGLNSRKEIWWEVFDGTDMGELGRNVQSKIQEQCLGTFNTIGSIHDIIPLVENHILSEATATDLCLAMLYAETKDLDKAKSLFAKTIKSSSNNPPFQEKVRRIATQYGA